MYQQMYIFFSQSPSLSRPLLHTCIFSILSGTSEKTTSLIHFTQSHLFFPPFLLFHSSLTGLYCLSLSLSSAAFFRNSSLQQTALSRNQQFCLREFRIKAITEPNRMKHSHQISPVWRAGFLSNWLWLWVVVHYWHVSPKFHIIHSVEKRKLMLVILWIVQLPQNKPICQFLLNEDCCMKQRSICKVTFRDYKCKIWSSIQVWCLINGENPTYCISHFWRYIKSIL